MVKGPCSIISVMNIRYMDEVDLPFCPKCKNSLRKASSSNMLCDACGLDYYVSPRPCNALIITGNDDRILLVKRAVEPSKGLWDLPGGFVNVEETVEESVIREAREELGVEVGDLEYLFSGYGRYTYKSLNYYTIGLVFTAKITSGKLGPQDDVAELKYFAVSQIPWNTLAFPVLEETLRKYIAERK